VDQEEDPRRAGSLGARCWSLADRAGDGAAGRASAVLGDPARVGSLV